MTGRTLMALALAFAQPASASALPICGTGKRVSCVVDGDTFWLGGEKFRIADIDAPEIAHPRCRAELDLGNRATARLAQLMEPGRFKVRRTGKDRYERTPLSRAMAREMPTRTYRPLECDFRLRMRQLMHVW